MPAGCRVRVKDLPLLEFPHVCELTALREVTNGKERLQQKDFADGRVRVPFYILARICEVEGAGTVRIRLFDENGERSRDSDFHFGEPGRYYTHIICYERYPDLKPGTYRVAVFLNERLLDERPIEVFPGNGDQQ